MSDAVHQALLALRDFLYARVYENPVVHDEFRKAQRILRDLFAWLVPLARLYFDLISTPLLKPLRSSPLNPWLIVAVRR